MKKILYLGWIGFRNLGDELMWDKFKELADQMLPSGEFSIIPSGRGVDIKNPDPYDMIVLGGGSLILPGYIQILHNALQRKKEVMIWGSGLDWLEKKRMKMLLQGKVPSYERLFADDYARRLAEVVEHAKFVGVRGPLTRSALNNVDIDMKKVEMSGDPGFLLNPSSSPARTYGSKMWKKDEKIIGLNWGTSYNKIYGKSELEVEEQLAKAAKEFIKQGYKIYMYWVWEPDRKHIFRLYEKIGDTQNVRTAPKLYNQYHLMNILKQCTFTINFKLHANVLSAVCNVPFIALGYRFKTFDFAASIDLQNYVISTDEQNLEQELLRRADEINTHLELIISKIMHYRESYEDKLKSPFLHRLFDC